MTAKKIVVATLLALYGASPNAFAKESSHKSEKNFYNVAFDDLKDYKGELRIVYLIDGGHWVEAGWLRKLGVSLRDGDTISRFGKELVELEKIGKVKEDGSDFQFRSNHHSIGYGSQIIQNDKEIPRLSEGFSSSGRKETKNPA